MYRVFVKSFKSLAEYIEAALETAQHEAIDDGKRVYAEARSFRGAWAEGRTLAEAKSQLREVLKGWIELQNERVSRSHL